MNRSHTWLFVLFIFVSAAATCLAAGSANSGPTIEEARVLQVQRGPDAAGGTVQKLQLEILTGNQAGQIVAAFNGNADSIGDISGIKPPEYHVGDLVEATIAAQPGPQQWIVIDWVRKPSLYWLLALFLVCATLIGGWRGLTSVIGLGVGLAGIIWVMLPLLSDGYNPIAVSAFSAFGIMLVTFYLAHGFNLKTTVAIAGTGLSLILTAALGWMFIHTTHLTGMSSEETLYLQTQAGHAFDLRGLLLAGIIIGGLGALNDITVSQSAVVFALRSANPALGLVDLYHRAMAVGRDHIASLVNTLVIAYAGAALPLLLLFVQDGVALGQVINEEFVASEIVRTLVSSLGLIVAVPLTTLLAATFSLRMSPAEAGRHEGDGHHHHH